MMKESQMTARLDELMAMQPVMPVLTVATDAMAGPLAEILVAAKLPVMEVTLRTPESLAAIRRMRMVPGAIVGAGTILHARDVEDAVRAGAQFIVTPGLSDATVQAAKRANVPILPGVASPSEVMRGLDLGLERFKFFPAEQAGGTAFLAALQGPFAAAKFCPTGGITPERAPEYLKLSNVAMVGGGWVATPQMLGKGDWQTIETNARAAAAMKRG
jgi:2-dehydro-3-deoxyphosphogluconate aldolase/(4S)-4-hydroxy-2-oxoglutarate aldolase